MSFDLQLKGQRALVTGGTKGLGAALVKSLKDAGVQVMTTARSAPQKPLEGVTYVQTDLTTEEGVALLARAVTENWGGVDILINSLGGSNAPAGGFAALSLSGILCLRHSMTKRNIYANQEEAGGSRHDGVAVNPQGAH